MTERDIFLMYILQIAELVAEMSLEEYEAWKHEIRKTYSEMELCFMEKIFIVTDHLVLT